ncbi:MAG TPA: DUF998 domain-containing protein [Nakamurella sp.]
MVNTSTYDSAANSGSAERTRGFVGGLLWVIAIVQYAVAQIIAAAAWTTPYSLRANYISDLGNTACGMFAVPHGQPAYVCSPSHGLMNASFIALGVLVIAGAILLRRFSPSGRMTSVAFYLWILSGLGKIVVGLVPENTTITLHLLGAFNIPVASVAILLFSLAIRDSNVPLSIFGIGTAVVGLVGTVLSTAGQYAGEGLYLGLGVGGMERVAGYPGSLWTLVVGALAMTFAGRTSDARDAVDDNSPVARL